MSDTRQPEYGDQDGTIGADTDVFPPVEYPEPGAPVTDDAPVAGDDDVYADAPQAYSATEGSGSDADAYAEDPPVEYDEAFAEPAAAASAAGSSERSSGINWPTVMMATGISAVISAIVLAIGLVGLMVDRSNGANSQQAPASVVNLGAATAPAAAAPQQAAPAPAEGEPAPAEDGAAELPAAIAPEPAPAPAPDNSGPTQSAPTSSSSRQPQAQSAGRHNTTPNSVRDASVQDLYIRTAKPSKHDLEWQVAAFWNPRLSMTPKVEVSYGGEKARAALTEVMQMSTMYDFFSLRSSATSTPVVNGNRAHVTFTGSMAGFPVQKVRYHYIREDGLWKFDWKRTCQELQCNGNPNFGY